VRPESWQAIAGSLSVIVALKLLLRFKPWRALGRLMRNG
jgi:hypothetical protein